MEQKSDRCDISYVPIYYLVCTYHVLVHKKWFNQFSLREWTDITQYSSATNRLDYYDNLDLFLLASRYVGMLNLAVKKINGTYNYLLSLCPTLG